jgi:hypothetical protein
MDEAKYRDCARLRACHEADAAGCATRARIGRGAIPIVIEAVTEADYPGRTCLNAEAAALALDHIHLQHAPVPLYGVCHLVLLTLTADNVMAAGFRRSRHCQQKSYS